MIRGILSVITEATPSTVISGVMSSDLDKAVKLLNKAGHKAKIYQGEWIGVYGKNDAQAKSNMKATLDGKLYDNNFDISEGVSFSVAYDTMKKKIKNAKKGDCDAIEKEVIKMHKQQKLTSGDFDELEAEIFRKKQSMK